MKLNIILSVLAMCSCATVTTPMGGPQDKQPPSLINSSPKLNQKNYKKPIVELTFSEDIKLKDAKEEIIITPSPGKEIEIKAKARTLTIEPKDGWKENTTYSISFREAVQDITEGNPVENLRLAFSTGPIIDSLSISGGIKDGLTEKIPDKITIGIYTSDTFDIFKHEPVYFTKSDKEGNFKIGNLKKDNYFIYAFEDKNKNLKVESQNEQFGFIGEPIELEKNKTKIKIPLVRIDTRKLKINKPRSTGDVAFLKFNKYITSYSLLPIEDKIKLNNSFSDDQSEIKLYLSELKTDSIQIRVIATDSLMQKIDTLVYLKKGKNQKVEEKLSIDVTTPYLETATGKFQFNISSNKLIKSINVDSVILELDSLTKIRFKDTDYKWDTVHKKIELTTFIDKKKINADNKISLITGKNFIQTFDNDSIKRSSRLIKLSTIEDTGNLIVELKTNLQENFIIQLLGGDKIIQSVTNTKKHTFRYLDPGSYKIRVVIDKNKNGVWDIGNIFSRQEPEQTIYYIDRDKKNETPMRANWESEITISF